MDKIPQEKVFCLSKINLLWIRTTLRIFLKYV